MSRACFKTSGIDRRRQRAQTEAVKSEMVRGLIDLIVSGSVNVTEIAIGCANKLSMRELDNLISGFGMDGVNIGRDTESTRIIDERHRLEASLQRCEEMAESIRERIVEIEEGE